MNSVIAKQADPVTRQEIQSVAVLAAGFGLVGVDRFLITTMYPVIAKDLHLSYGDIGLITGALALAWGVAALFTGNLSDRIGRRTVLTAALVVFSVLIGASGLAIGLISLIGVRIMMGFADGAYTPASITATLAASPLRRHGLSIGIQQMMLPLCGLGLAPLFVARVLDYIDWRWVFLFFTLPGLLLAYCVWRIIPAPERVSKATRPPARALAGSIADWRVVLAEANVRVAAAGMLCWLTCLVTTSSFMPNYLTDHLRLTLPQMASVMSAIGLGSTVGTLLLAWASDRLGRRPVMLISSTGALLSLIALSQIGPAPGMLFTALFCVHFFNNALITLTVGPLCSEAVPVSLMATASGLVIAVGELFGGGLAPVIVGQVAQHLGIERMLWLPMGAMACGFLLCLAIKKPIQAVPGHDGASTNG